MKFLAVTLMILTSLSAFSSNHHCEKLDAQAEALLDSVYESAASKRISFENANTLTLAINQARVEEIGQHGPRHMTKIWLVLPALFHLGM